MKERANAAPVDYEETQAAKAIIRASRVEVVGEDIAVETKFLGATLRIPRLDLFFYLQPWLLEPL
jgi:hypothetical protein